MRTAIKVLSIIAIVIGGFAVIGAFTESSFEEALYSLVGGGLYLGYGICVLVYLNKSSEIPPNRK